MESEKNLKVMAPIKNFKNYDLVYITILGSFKIL